MANPSGNNILIPFLLLLSCLMSLHATAALSFSYNFAVAADLNSKDLVYINDSTPAGDRINLTKGTENHSTGRVYHRQPVRLWHKRKQRSSFSTSFTFAIGGSDTLDRGDGMAFFIGPPDLPPNSGSMFLGLFSNPNYSSSPESGTVGVEFDTCRNDGLDPPDTADHIGIDINNITSKNTTNLPNKSLYGTMSANITYDGGSTMMKVSLRLASGSTYSLDTPVDFRGVGVPQYAHVGFSAATGVLTESHQLLSWSFNSTDPSNRMLWAILASVVSASLLVGLIAALLCVIIRRHQWPRRHPSTEIELPVAKKFSYRELSAATGNFSKDRMIGSGAFGEVYKGELSDPRMPLVAVKQLTKMLDQTKRDYVTEITTLGQLSHKNLIKLVGWCNNGRSDYKLLLVYELVMNQSLDKHLHVVDGAPVLGWSKRYKIILGISAAIDYLHNNYLKTILHRDIKPSNVMLDDEFEAKLGDFGLVRQVWPGQSSLKDTAMVGSWNYIDPRCVTDGTVSTASDMYSFGVLLLEVATGKNPVVVPDKENGPIQNTLVNAVRRSYAQGAILEMADQRLNGNFDRTQMERVLLVGLLCVHEDRQSRPGIKDAVYLLSNMGHQLPEILIRA